MRILEWKCMKLDNISLNCVPECQINITPTLHQMMAWCDEPLSQPMRFSLLTHIYVLLKWKHISRHWPFVQGIHRFDRWIPRTKGKWRGAVMFFFFYLCSNKRLSKQSRRWWFETPSLSLWRHCNGKLSMNTLTRAQFWRHAWLPLIYSETRVCMLKIRAK